MKPVLVTSGEPAGIGPDICLALAAQKLPVVVLADKQIIVERAKALSIPLHLRDYNPLHPPTASDFRSSKNMLWLWSIPSAVPVQPGQLDARNAPYVLKMLQLASQSCSQQQFAALVTAPVHKGILSEAGHLFTGHTEFFAEYFSVPRVVMMLASKNLRVALVTTHLPLAQVPSAITVSLLSDIIQQLDYSLQKDFGISKPAIFVAGLNPHAGEGGHLGREEIDVIIPCIHALQNKGIHVKGPFAADTLFTQANLQQADVFVTMFHDQGLPVLKYASFGQSVNITLGLPIIRTSVDHGTALDLAGTGRADPSSLIEAVQTALTMSELRGKCQKSL